MEKAIKVVKEIFEIDPRFTLPGSRNVPFQRKTEREHYFLTLHGGLPE